MTNRMRGPLCVSHVGTNWIDEGTLVRQQSTAPGIRDSVPALHGPFDQHFLVLDSRTKRPIANTPYRIRLSSGGEFRGVTDNLGYTQKVGANHVTTAILEIPHHGNGTSGADAGKQYDTCCR